MFIPNQTCQLTRISGVNDRYGEPIFLDPIDGVECALVKLEPVYQHTSVRADSSASRANAEEMTITAVMLFPAYVTVAQNDVIQFDGYRLEVKMVHPRHNVLGQLDHFEVHAAAKEM